MEERNILMEGGWRQRRNNAYLLTQNDENEDHFTSNCPVQRETSAKNTLFHLAQTDLDQSLFEDWLQHKSSNNKQPLPTTSSSNRLKPARRTFHARPFADRTNNAQSPTAQSIIPRLKQQLLKLESVMLTGSAQVEKRKVEILPSKLGKKQDIIVFQDILHSLRTSMRIKNTPLPRKSAKLPLPNYSPEPKSRKLFSRGISSKQLRERNQQILMRQQVRRNRTLNNLLQCE